MPLLLVLPLIASVMPLPWPAAMVLLPDWAMVGVAFGPVLLFGVLFFTFSVRTAAAIHCAPDRRREFARRFARWRRVAFWLNLILALLPLFVFGWGKWVHTALRTDPTLGRSLAPFAELLVPAPWLLALALSWLASWPIERVLARTATPPRAYWSLFGHWLHHARLFFVPGGLMLVLCVFGQTASRLLYPVSEQLWYQVLSSLAVFALFPFLPLLLRPLLGLKRLPSGPQRTQLEATAKRLGVRFSDLLLWPTSGGMANAMVVGVLPWARYVILTDALLEGMDAAEVDAVFGHEAGHARYGHLSYYALFLLLSSSALSGLGLIVGRLLPLGEWLDALPDWATELVPLPALLFFGLYLFGVFGYLSRVCERQADIFGARAGSCTNPACEGHTEETVLAQRGKGLCPTGLKAMARALEKVMTLNGWEASHGRGGNMLRRAWGWVRAWQHGPVPVRIDYLLTLTTRPATADRHDRKAFWVRVLLACGLFAVAVAGMIVGWSEMAKMAAQ